jgi:hypothetical protein
MAENRLIVEQVFLANLTLLYIPKLQKEGNVLKKETIMIVGSGYSSYSRVV